MAIGSAFARIVQPIARCLRRPARWATYFATAGAAVVAFLAGVNEPADFWTKKYAWSLVLAAVWIGASTLAGFLDDYWRAPGQLVKPTDAIVTEQGGLIMLEATVRGIPVEALVSGTPGSINRYLDRITDKFEQIALVVDDIAEGRLRIPGVDDSGVCNVFPVLVLLHPFPQHYSTWDALDHDIESRRLLDKKSSWIRMREFQIITAEELEMLEPHLQSGLSMVELLRAKIGSVQYRQRSLKDFLVREWKLPSLTNPRLDRLFGEAFDVVGTLVRPNVHDAIWDVEGEDT